MERTVAVPVILSYDKYPEHYGLDLEPTEFAYYYTVYAGERITIVTYRLYEDKREPTIVIPLNYFKNKQLCERIIEYFFIRHVIRDLEVEINRHLFFLQDEIKCYEKSPEIIQELIEEIREKVKEFRKLRNRLKELNIVNLYEEVCSRDGDICCVLQVEC